MANILLIDDEKDFGLFVKMNLELTGKYRVTLATNGRDGVSAALRHPPNIILLDVMMPDMSGFEVLEKLKGSDATSSIPVVMLTAVGTEEAKERALGLFNEDYVVKPVSIAELKNKIDSVLGRHR